MELRNSALMPHILHVPMLVGPFGLSIIQWCCWQSDATSASWMSSVVKSHFLHALAGALLAGSRYSLSSIGVYSRSIGPVYWSRGLSRMLFSNCSMTWAVQPGMRPMVKMEMNRSSGMSSR